MIIDFRVRHDIDFNSDINILLPKLSFLLGEIALFLFFFSFFQDGCTDQI